MHGPIKIAVLDTGVDLTHPDMRACEDHIKGQLNWIGGQDMSNISDSSGHGTYTAGLLLDYAPDADLFIAKIAEKSPSAPSIIAKVRFTVSK